MYLFQSLQIFRKKNYGFWRGNVYCTSVLQTSQTWGRTPSICFEIIITSTEKFRTDYAGRLTRIRSKVHLAWVQQLYLFKYAALRITFVFKLQKFIQLKFHPEIRQIILCHTKNSSHRRKCRESFRYLWFSLISFQVFFLSSIAAIVDDILSFFKYVKCCSSGVCPITNLFSIIHYDFLSLSFTSSPIHSYVDDSIFCYYFQFEEISFNNSHWRNKLLMFLKF